MESTSLFYAVSNFSPFFFRKYDLKILLLIFRYLSVSVAILLISAGTAGLLLARKLRRPHPRTSQVMTFFSTLVVVLGAYFLDRVTGRPPDNVRAVPNLENGQAELMLENQ